MTTWMDRCGDFLLDRALDAARRRARLTPASLRLSFGQIEYLQRLARQGKSPTAVVMLHGAAADKTSWLRLARYLPQTLPLIAPDLPGHGASVADLALDYGIRAQALRVEQFLATLGVERVHLLGNSMGGAVALAVAAAFPRRVASLVLIGTAGAEATPSWLREHVCRSGVNPMIDVRDVAGYRTMLKIGMAAPPYVPGIVLRALTRRLIGRHAINRKIVADISRDLDRTADLSRIAAPTLILWGAADRVQHVDDAELLRRRLPDSRKLVLDGVGHVPMVEAPRAVAAACSAFYADIARR